MPFADNNGIKIYFRVEGEGTPLILHHWSFATLDWWDDYGYINLLKQKYQLILVDARGHGRSDKYYHPEAYSMINRVNDIISVLDELSISKAHYLGYSMGGWIGFGIAKYAPDRFYSLIIGGQHPYPQNLEHLRQFAYIGIQKGSDAFIQEWEINFGPLSDIQKTRINTYDFKALAACATNRESYENILSGIDIPCLLFDGSKDDIYPYVKQCSHLICGSEFISLPGLNHQESIRESGIVVPYVLNFLESVKYC